MSLRSFGELKLMERKTSRREQLLALSARREEKIGKKEPTIQLAFSELPSVVLLSTIPEIQPYLTPDLLSDLLDMYWRGGIKNAIKQYNINQPEQTQAEIINYVSQMTFFNNFEDLRNVILGINPNLLLNNLDQIVNEGGRQEIIEAIDKADPADPVSIIFNHSSQFVNKETQKIEIELILNEPEVIEREDMICKCGSRRIQTGTKQMRSADEPPHIQARCVSCKRFWTISAA